MFSHASVILPMGGVHGGGGVCVAGGMCGRGHAWQGACMVGGMHGRGHVW